MRVRACCTITPMREAKSANTVRRPSLVLVGICLAVALPAGLTLPGCITNEAGKSEFHPEAILGVAAICAAGVFVPHLYDDTYPTDFDRQWDEIERSQKVAHDKRR
jgi:hypothetical protein